MQIKNLTAILALAGLNGAYASPSSRRSYNATSCKKTSVAILGAGTAGITAAQGLTNESVTDFLIVEYKGDIGGRVAHTTFGASNQSYTVELGANWVYRPLVKQLGPSAQTLLQQVQGTVTPPGPQNPIWSLALLYNLTNTYSDYTSLETFNQDGTNNFTDLFGQYQAAYSTLEQDAGYILTENLQDRSVQAGLSLAGWKPHKNTEAQATEWFQWDFEYAYPPEQSSQEFGIVNYNTTFYQYSPINNYVFDSRGFNAFIKETAATFLTPNDPRLLLNTIVTNVSYSATGVTVHNQDGSCIDADYAICTFSLGVLQNDVITFDPELPSWKQMGIATFRMGTYTKIFLQFPPDQVFWNKSTQFFLYADPVERGYYPVFQSLDGPGFLEGSGILFVTVVNQQSYQVESQDDNTTKAQVLAVLRTMFGASTVPDPIAFMYPRWSLEPWAFGSYSNWPPGTTLEMHQNLRANLGRLYFAGEATSAEYFGFLQGAFFEGQAVAGQVADCITGEKNCTGELNYEQLHGTTPPSEYNIANGWDVSSFLAYGFGG